MTKLVIDERWDADLRDLRSLRLALRARGLDAPDTARVLVQMALHTSIVVGGGALALFGEGLPTTVLGAVICAIGSLGVGTNAHTASHGATFRKRGWNSALTFFGYPLMLGYSASFWLDKHIRHHRAPNVVGVDTDLDLAPVFAIIEPQREQAAGFARLWYAAQWIFLVPIIGLNCFQMSATGLGYVLSQLAARTRRSLHWFDLGALLAHGAIWASLAAFFPWERVLLLFCVRYVVLGYLLFAAFAPAHMPHEAACFEGAIDGRSRERAVFASTLDFRSGLFGRLFLSGVEYQIEHHLFPHVCHTRYPEIAPVVEAYCRKHDIPYRTIDWSDGIARALAVFRTPKPIVSATEASS